jgi:hypothetical protein
LNNRPGKNLGYLTPFEAYFGYCPFPKYRDRPQVRDWKKQYEKQKERKIAESNQTINLCVASEC